MAGPVLKTANCARDLGRIEMRFIEQPSQLKSQHCTQLRGNVNNGTRSLTNSVQSCIKFAGNGWLKFRAPLRSAPHRRQNDAGPAGSNYQPLLYFGTFATIAGILQSK